MEADAALKRAGVLIDMRRPDEAASLIAQVLAGEPDNEKALVLLGRALVYQGQFQDALAASERLLQVSPDNPQGLLRMANMLQALGRPREGVPFARRAVELHPNEPVCLVNLAEALNAVTHGSAEARQLAERAVTVDPDYGWAHRVIGKVHLDNQQYGKAEETTLQALRADPADRQAILQLGMARAGRGRFAESREQVLAALRLEATPDAIDEVINKIECRGIPPHFAELYTMALAARGLPDLSYPGAAGDVPELLAAQGRLAWRMHVEEAGDDGMRRAGELAEAVLATDPGNADARYVRSLELSRAGDHERASELAEQLDAEGYPRVHLALIRTRSSLKDYAGALEAARRRLATNPDDVLYLRAEAFSLVKLKRFDEALTAARRAASLVPSARDVQLLVGMAAKGAGDIPGAERAMRAAIADAPREGMATAQLAWLLAEAGRWEEAEELLAGIPAGIPDPEEVARACMGITSVALKEAVPSLSALDDEDPAPASLTECARWLGIILRMFMTAAAYGPEVAEPAIAKWLPPITEGLHKVAASPESGFAHVVRGYDEFLERRQVAPTGRTA